MQSLHINVDYYNFIFKKPSLVDQSTDSDDTKGGTGPRYQSWKEFHGHRQCCFNNSCGGCVSTSCVNDQWLDSPTVVKQTNFAETTNHSCVEYDLPPDWYFHVFHRKRKYARYLQYRRWPVNQLLPHHNAQQPKSSDVCDQSVQLYHDYDDAFQRQTLKPQEQYSNQNEVMDRWQRTNSFLVPIDEVDEEDSSYGDCDHRIRPQEVVSCSQLVLTEVDNHTSASSSSSLPASYHTDSFTSSGQFLTTHHKHDTNKEKTQAVRSNHRKVNIRKARSEGFLSTNHRYHRLSDNDIDSEPVNESKSSDQLDQFADENTESQFSTKRKSKFRTGSLTSLITSTLQEGFNRMFRSRTITSIHNLAKGRKGNRNVCWNSKQATGNRNQSADTTQSRVIYFGTKHRILNPKKKISNKFEHKESLQELQSHNHNLNELSIQKQNRHCIIIGHPSSSNKLYITFCSFENNLWMFILERKKYFRLSFFCLHLIDICYMIYLYVILLILLLCIKHFIYFFALENKYLNEVIWILT